MPMTRNSNEQLFLPGIISIPKMWDKFNVTCVVYLSCSPDFFVVLFRFSGDSDSFKGHPSPKLS